MTKTDVLNMLVKEYQASLRRPDDLSIRDYQEAVKQSTGKEVSARRAARDLNSLSGYVRVYVMDCGHRTQVWRKVQGKRSKK